MKKIELTKDFYKYQFEPEENRILGQNIYILYSDNECIVFDAGYERHMKQLLPEIENYKIKNVICTHFHPDHCYGLNVLENQHVIGSKYAIETLTFFEDVSNEKLVPTTLITEDTTIKFHNHVIKLSLNKGHSNCGMLIDIDSTFVLTGDEYMTTNKNEPVLPYVASNIPQHISSLEHIIDNYEGYTFLPSHGLHTSNLKGFTECLNYLRFANTREKDIQKYYTSSYKFLNERWHLLNIRR